MKERKELVEEIMYRAGGGLLDRPWPFYEEHEKVWGLGSHWTDEQLVEAGKEMDKEDWGN